MSGSSSDGSVSVDSVSVGVDVDDAVPRLGGSGDDSDSDVIITRVVRASGRPRVPGACGSARGSRGGRGERAGRGRSVRKGGRRGLAPVVLPMYDLPGSMEIKLPWSVHFSIVSQIDGLIFSVLGGRVEWDVLATSRSSAVCDVFGREPYMSCSSALGWYLCDFSQIHLMVAMVASHRGCGVFVVPTRPTEGAMFEFSPSFAKTRGGVKRPDMWWYDYLMSKAVMVFTLGSGALLRTGRRIPWRFTRAIKVCLLLLHLSHHYDYYYSSYYYSYYSRWW